IHISEMAWGKKVRHPSDVLKQGDWVDAVVLSIKPDERRLALGLKQTVTDPWSEIPQRFPVGAQVEGPVTKLMKFGAFVQIADGVEGLVHISEMVADRRLNHPSEVVREGQTVQAQVLGIDTAKRQIKLSMKQLIPTGLDEYFAEHNVGDAVSGRVVEVTNNRAMIELGEGVRGICTVKDAEKEASPAAGSQAVDLSSLTSMLQARWKGNTPSTSAKTESLHAGQIRGFKIAKLDAAAKSIELELT
ncbi:MAG: S1 RNA-binding domain-containing protein, partial [Acidobacteriota bacterium]|nr:S1 RNA-binding domain-containing protein [Acidobacteriota bacterium]